MMARILILALVMLVMACSARQESAQAVSVPDPSQEDAGGEDDRFAPVSESVAVVEAENRSRPIAIIDASEVDTEADGAAEYCEEFRGADTRTEAWEPDAGEVSDARCEVIRDRESAAVVATRESDGRWRFALLLFADGVERIELEVRGRDYEPAEFQIWEFAINPTRATLRYRLEGASSLGRIEAVCAIARSKRCEFFEVAE